ncbi:DUF423 domain-containing protein [Flagellimonas zhangzhouensis]|uniref:Uncharacterized membrane protein YgdD, TMEM256/DUF423 family n=1 Tax=Flagellimonas zhangzhouensis TaxID=1073328 RepID=A0A1H2VFA3_9FLAO|nr:DUF423 domain-containing protein [Allomuricauda zhangzhouensis]SDQ08262.1 Uncharacterized membrane protein YgdD, TMEM256/DUF423 family [Allomuricauda zhangzhouensis]SDW66998.1 Uncharacterized membrane protein YgdD, TMEM256/DUF423 family [Allomuricauda zhangzhouensis]
MNRTILLTGIVLGLLAVILGAFGAHGLEKLVEKDAIETYEVGVRYQMYHALFLLFVGLWTGIAEKTKRRVFIFVLIGVILFSGSIYLLTMNDLTSFDFKIIGFLTPIGGVFMILGWVYSGYHILTHK